MTAPKPSSHATDIPPHKRPRDLQTVKTWDELDSLISEYRCEIKRGAVDHTVALDNLIAIAEHSNVCGERSAEEVHEFIDAKLKAAPDTEDKIDRVVEIERLASLKPLDYEVARTEAANRLGVRVTAMDTEVEKTRRALRLETGNDDDKGQGQAVTIADVLPWPEPVDGDMLACSLVAVVKRYIVLSDAAADIIAFWILHTWLVNEFHISPRLALTSPTKGCGKTTVLSLLNLLVRRPKRAGSISPAALFRVINQFQPTLLLDENEKYLQLGSDFHALLNEGHAKGGKVIRVLGEQQELCEFNVFGAVAFARNGKIPDDLEQRSIVIRLHRKKADEECGELRPVGDASLQRVARMCARWSDDYRLDVTAADPDMVGLINRIADNWRPLFAIADVLGGGEWPLRIRAAAMESAPRETLSIGPMLLADIKAVFDAAATNKLWSKTICSALAAMEGRPWAEWGKEKRPLTKYQLADLLDDFDIDPKTVRIGSLTKKGYHRHQFEDLWERYRSPQGVGEPSHRHNADEMGTNAAFQSVTPDSDVTVQQRDKSASNGLCDGVTD